MCGIIGYVTDAIVEGGESAVHKLVHGLEQLRNRGYDSAGIVVHDDGALFRERTTGDVQSLLPALEVNGFMKSCCGIAHTRWATHGAKTVENAHPHADVDGRIMLVHNGMIGNYRELKRELEKKYRFTSQTDTEAVVHLIRDVHDKNGRKNLFEATKEALKSVEGTYAIALVHVEHPDTIIVARRGSPLVIGVAEHGQFVASEARAFAKYTDTVVYLEDNDVALIRPREHVIETIEHSRRVIRERRKLELAQYNVDLGEYPKHTLREIHRQPDAIIDATRGRYVLDGGMARLGGLESVKEALYRASHVHLVGAGTAGHAAGVGQWIFETYAPSKFTQAYSPDEFVDRRLHLKEEEDVVFVISQSGETADTLRALEAAHYLGVPVYGIVNVEESTIARADDAGVYLRIGPEIGVASTGAFTAQLAVLLLSALYIGRRHEVHRDIGIAALEALARVPERIAWVLGREETIKALAYKYAQYDGCFFLGRGYNKPLAQEGALKLLELSYVHAQALSLKEMKHGYIARVDKQFPAIVLAPQDGYYKDALNNIEELTSRECPVLALVTEGDRYVRDKADDVIEIPALISGEDRLFNIFPEVVAMQLFAYYVAEARGCDIDKPRNLAKAVTVE
jgi:glucosamine--fructose-6-phosphate aminotransferase (isomerizing)